MALIETARYALAEGSAIVDEGLGRYGTHARTMVIHSSLPE
jgi:hypothetical protein